jgi:hypothetical protein
MITIQYQGRLGNNMIQYFAGRILAEKSGLFLSKNPHYDYWHKYFGIEAPNTMQIGTEIENIHEENFLNRLEQKQLPLKHYVLKGYFQKKIFLHTYKKYIKNIFNIIYNNTDPQQVFVHYRIGDTQNTKSMLPIEYYEDALSRIDCRGGYIASDSINHSNINKLYKTFNLIPINLSPIDTIHFGKNFNNLVLSEGTFSWWIGFLSKADRVVCNRRDYQWFGSDIFDFDNWQKLNWDYDTNNQPIQKL